MEIITQRFYYNIDKSLPQSLPSNVANKKLSDEFGMSNIHMVMIKNGMSQKELSNMQKEIDKVDGVEWCLGMNSVIGSSIPIRYDSFFHERDVAK